MISGNFMKKRIYNEKVEIDQKALKEFWEKRAQKYDKINPYISIKLNDQNPECVATWDAFEKKEILPKLHIDEFSYVLDIGCGVGRLSQEIIDTAKYYIGADFSENLVKIAKSRIKPTNNHIFVVAPFQEINIQNNITEYAGFFNKIIIAGVCTYINDRELEKCFNNLLDLISMKCTIYIVEPVAVENRLTLDQIYSEALNSDYSAIYRTIDEYHDLFRCFQKDGFDIIESKMLPRDTNSHSDTCRHYFILHREI